MTKVTPDPPKADNASEPESPDLQKPDVDYVHFSPADIRATPRKPPTWLTVDPEIDVQELLGFVSEALASACVITMDQADRETGTTRNTLLGIHLIMTVSEIKVNRALDILDPIE